MVAAVKITRMAHSAADLRGLAAKSNDAAQVRRLLALALIVEDRCAFGLTRLQPRPFHPKKDAAAQETEVAGQN